jgi:hypothetical protein
MYPIEAEVPFNGTNPESKLEVPSEYLTMVKIQNPLR